MKGYKSMSQLSDRRSGLTLILWLLSAAALIGLLLFCTSCSAEEPTPTQPTSASFEVAVLADQNAYDLNAVLQDFYQTNHNLPAALASTMSAFPSRVEACGVSTSDPVELTEVLYYSEHGGDIQKALLDELRNLFEDPNTRFLFVETTGVAQITQARMADEDDPDNPVMELFWSEMSFDHDPQLLILSPDPDDTTWFNIALIDLKTGGCRCEMPNDAVMLAPPGFFDDNPLFNMTPSTAMAEGFFKSLSTEWLCQTQVRPILGNSYQLVILRNSF